MVGSWSILDKLSISRDENSRLSYLRNNRSSEVDFVNSVAMNDKGKGKLSEIFI